jgi:hypothetical protein
MTGGAGSGDILPNGHFATNCQYNENGPDVGALVLAGGMMSGSLAQEVHFVNCHSEHSSYIVRTDATEPGLLSFVFVGGTHFYTADFFRLDPATTSITQFRIAACNLEGPSFTMAAQFFVDCQVVGTYIGSNVALSGGGTLAFSGNSVFGNLALSGNWTALVVNTTLRGSFSNTATGAVSVAIPGNSIVLGAPVSGADFGSHTASGVTDLSRHVQLYTGYAGINVTASAMNFVIAGAAPLSVIEGSNSGLLAARLAGSLSYANDAAAAAGGIPVGVLYRNGSVVQVRVA